MLCDPLLLPSIFPRIRIFSSELVFHLKFPKYWSYTFTSDSSKEYSPLGLTGLIFLQTKEVKIIFPSTTIYRHQFFNTQPSLWSNSHIYTTTIGKTIYWQTDVSAFEYPVEVCHSFPSKEQVSFNFIATVTVHSDFGAQENKICHCFHFFPPSTCHGVMGPDAVIFIF